MVLWCLPAILFLLLGENEPEPTPKFRTDPPLFFKRFPLGSTPCLQYGSTSNSPRFLLQCPPRKNRRRTRIFRVIVEASEMANTDLLARLDAAIAEKNLLNHPFYQD